MTLAELIAVMPGITAETPNSEVAAWLRESVSVVGAIGSRVLLRWGAANARLDKLEAAKTGHASDAIRAVAAAALLTVQREDTELDMADAGHVTLVDALVAGGVLTVDDKAELVALATVQMSRLKANGLKEYDDVSALYHIKQARGA